MSYLVSYTLTVPPVIKGLPDILCQRILAEGYCLASGDPGKYIFKRNWDWVTRASFAWSGGSWDRAPVTLTVSFLPTPERIEVRFKFERASDLDEQEAAGFQQFCHGQFDEFLKHLNQWLA